MGFIILFFVSRLLKTRDKNCCNYNRLYVKYDRKNRYLNIGDSFNRNFIYDCMSINDTSKEWKYCYLFVKKY